MRVPIATTTPLAIPTPSGLKPVELWNEFLDGAVGRWILQKLAYAWARETERYDSK